MKTVAVILTAVALGSWALGQLGSEAGGLGHQVHGLPTTRKRHGELDRRSEPPC